MRLTLIACLGLAACGSSHSGADAEEMVDCSTVTGVDTFVVGLEKMGAKSNADLTYYAINHLARTNFSFRSS